MQDRLSRDTLLATAIRSIGTPSFMPELTDVMRAVTMFRGIFVVRLAEDGKPAHVYDNVRAERRAVVVDRWLDAAWHLDPFVAAFQKGLSRPVMPLDDVAPDRFSQSPYYHTYYKSVRLRDEMAMFLPLADTTLFFSIGRLAGERRFSRRDVTRLEAAHDVLSALCEQHFARAARSAAPIPEGASFATLAGRIDSGLTERETEVVRLILRGHSSRSVAMLLEVSPATVKVHRKNIYRKLGISSQSELFARFLRIAGSG